MKKGFTLIELLIVMVIIATMVAVALPKYRVSLERSRAVEGIHNVTEAAEYLNARYVINGNKYTSTMNADLIPSKFFTAPAVTVSTAQNAVVSVTRQGATSYNYSIKATVSNGASLTLSCSGNARICDGLDLPISSI